MSALISNISDIIVVSTLLLLMMGLFLVNSGWFVSSTKRLGINLILCVLILSKLDEFWQQNLIQAYDTTFLLSGSAAFILIGPMLLYLVNIRVGNPNHSSLSLLKNCAVIIPILVYLLWFWWLPGDSIRSRLIETGEVNNWITRIVIPVYGDVILLLFSIACLKTLSDYGVKLRNWFSNIEDQNINGLKKLLSLWFSIWLLHLIWTFSSGVMDLQAPTKSITLLLQVGQLIFVFGLIVEHQLSAQQLQLTDYSKLAHVNDAPNEIEASNKVAPSYDPGTRQLVADELRKKEIELFFLDPSLTLPKLADIVSAPPRLVSETLNLTLHQSFYDYVNELRILYASNQLKTHAELSVLEIAFSSGFRSKSTFNNAFKKHFGITPSQFRKS